MEAQLVITGLCSILNPFGETPAMSAPGLIVVDTSSHGGHHEHVPFLAYDSNAVDFTGAMAAVVVPNTSFFYILLDGVELVIVDNPLGTPPKPTADHSFRDLVAHLHEYWPESAGGEPDRDYVPKPTQRPKKTAVKAWMRFGSGSIGASRISKVPWRFTNSDGMTLQRHFAEEVFYSGFPHSTDAVVIQLRDLESDVEGETLTFKLKDSSSTDPLTLFIGNSMEEDMPSALFREVTERVEHPYSTHFAFLNRVAGQDDGPIPVCINPAPNGGGGGSAGACGPGSGNGKPSS